MALELARKWINGRWKYVAQEEAAGGGGGGATNVISSDDPGAIGAGNIWVRTDPSETYAPTLQVRNATDDGWLDDSNVGVLLGLTYYDENGDVDTVFYGDSGGATIAGKVSAPLGGGQLRVRSDAELFGDTSVKLIGPNNHRVEVNADGVEITADAVEVDGDTVTLNADQVSLNSQGGVGFGGGTLQVVGDSVVLFAGATSFWQFSPEALLIRKSPGGPLLGAGVCAVWYDDTNGAAKIKFNAKTADGTTVTGEIPLAP